MRAPAPRAPCTRPARPAPLWQRARARRVHGGAADKSGAGTGRDGQRALAPGPAHWTLESGHWRVDTGHWTLDTGHQTPDTGHQTLDTRHQTLDTSRAVMVAVSELVPFAREILSQKPNGKMVKIYAVGTALALIGAVLGLLETVCSPFTPAAEEREWPLRAPRHRARREERPAGKRTEQGSPMRQRKHAS